MMHCYPDVLNPVGKPLVIQQGPTRKPMGSFGIMMFLTSRLPKNFGGFLFPCVSDSITVWVDARAIYRKRVEPWKSVFRVV